MKENLTTGGIKANSSLCLLKLKSWETGEDAEFYDNLTKFLQNWSSDGRLYYASSTQVKTGKSEFTAHRDSLKILPKYILQ